MTRGVVLLAFGKKGYAEAAHNLALSIKRFNKDIKICLIIQEKIYKYLMGRVGWFDDIFFVHDSLVYSEKGVDPAKVKTNIYKFLPYDENLYLDVDAACLKDITPLMDELSAQDGFYLTDVRSLSKREENNKNYNIWADNEDIWDFFELDDQAVLPAIQSSFCYIKKGPEAARFFQTVQEFYEKKFPLKKLKFRWGGTLPDELIFSAACAKHNLDPSAEVNPIFFGWRGRTIALNEIPLKYYFTAIYGNGVGSTLTKKIYIDWYNNLIKQYSRDLGVSHIFGTGNIMAQKHANN